MSILQQLQERSGSTCELTVNTENLVAFEVPPGSRGELNDTILISESLLPQLSGQEPLDSQFWQQHLPGSMWSEVPAVQVVIWRLLNRMKQESWATESLDMLYLDDELLNWARSGGEIIEATDSDVHKDSNGVTLDNGDTVVLTKSLDVKGSTINARIGTVVKNIRLVADNTEQIEGKIEGQQIVILTKFVRKHNA
jgi:protein PhnA